MLTFRTYLTKNDPDAICKIAASTGFFDENDVELNRKLAEKALRNKDCGYEYIIAEFGGEPVAYVCFGELPDAREGTFEIFWLSTLNSFRGCGIGHQLFSRLSEILKERDAQKLYVKTDNTDQYYPTRKFYEKCGFRREAVLKEYYDRKDDCCIYGMDFPKRKNNIWKRQNNKVKAPTGALIFYDIEFSFLPLRIKDFFRLIDFHFLKFPTQPAFGFLYLPQVFMINDAIFNQQDGKSLFALAQNGQVAANFNLGQRNILQRMNILGSEQ